MRVVPADDGVRIAYRTRGSGPRALVFLHPWGASARYFDETIERLDPWAVRAVALDVRGHGDSDKPDADLTLDRIARDVFTVADHAGVDAFVAVGHSMGGKLAQYLAVADPSRVEGLVLVESAPAGSLPTPEFVARWVRLAGDGDAFVDEVVRPYLHRRVAEHVLGRLGADWAKIPGAYLERTLALVESSFAGRLEHVRLPVVVVAGAHDPNHSAMADAVTARFPDAVVLVLDCGAELPIELPSELARLIERFAAGLPRRAL